MADKTLDAIQNVISGRSIFEKTYTFDEINLEVDVKMHYPSLKENARVNAFTSDIFLNTEQDSVQRMIYNTLFLLNEADEGTKVYQLVPAEEVETDENGNQIIDAKGNPKLKEVIKKIEKENYFSVDGYARPDVLYQIAQDVTEWMSRFRG